MTVRPSRQVLASEAQQESAINVARGQADALRAAFAAEAERMLSLAHAKADATRAVAEALKAEHADESLRFALAADYVTSTARTRATRADGSTRRRSTRRGQAAADGAWLRATMRGADTPRAESRVQVAAFAKLAKSSNTLVVPADVASVPSVLALAMAAAGAVRGNGKAAD